MHRINITESFQNTYPMKQWSFLFTKNFFVYLLKSENVFQNIPYHCWKGRTFTFKKSGQTTVFVSSTFSTSGHFSCRAEKPLYVKKVHSSNISSYRLPTIVVSTPCQWRPDRFCLIWNPDTLRPYVEWCFPPDTHTPTVSRVWESLVVKRGTVFITVIVKKTARPT